MPRFGYCPLPFTFGALGALAKDPIAAAWDADKGDGVKLVAHEIAAERLHKDGQLHGRVREADMLEAIRQRKEIDAQVALDLPYLPGIHTLNRKRRYRVMVLRSFDWFADDCQTIEASYATREEALKCAGTWARMPNVVTSWVIDSRKEA